MGTAPICLRAIFVLAWENSWKIANLNITIEYKQLRNCQLWLVHIDDFLKRAISWVRKRYILTLSHWLFFQVIFIFILYVCLLKSLT